MWPDAKEWDDVGLELVERDVKGLYDTADHQPTAVITVRGENEQYIQDGLRQIAELLNERDAHIAAQTLKLEPSYDGRRDGPFAPEYPIPPGRIARLKQKLMR